MGFGYGRSGERLLMGGSAPESDGDREDRPRAMTQASIHGAISHQFHFEGSGFRKVLVAQ
jgi:hypothetical protein